MTLTFTPTDFSRLDHCELLARWENDPSIRHFITPARDEASASQFRTAEMIQDDHRNRPAEARTVADLFIAVEGQIVGHCGILIDPPHRVSREGKVAWIGITIGLPEHRGKGIGRKTLAHLEALSRELGADLVEAGVFEFNPASLKLFRSSGYQEIVRIPELTWWNGRKWADIRFIKKLKAASPVAR